MLKRLKSVSTLLFLMGVSTGTAYAVAESGITDVKSHNKMALVPVL